MFTKKGDKAMTKELIATRKYNGEAYSFYINKPEYQGEKGCCGIEIVPYITVETPENGFGYSDTVIYDNIKDIAYTLNRYLQPWILKKIKATAKKLYTEAI